MPSISYTHVNALDAAVRVDREIIVEGDAAPLVTALPGLVWTKIAGRQAWRVATDELLPAFADAV